VVERLFVGGPWDGRREQVTSSLSDFAVAHVAGPAVYATEDTAATLDTRMPHTKYRLHVAPTGERVFLADGALWNGHVDTEAWPRRIAPGHSEWKKIHAWFWVGTGIDEDMVPPPVWLWRLTVTYVMADVSRSPDWLRAVQQTDGWELAEDEPVRNGVRAVIAKDLRAALDYELLPTCPRPGCAEKAVFKLIVPIREEWRFSFEPLPFRPGLDRIEQLCGEHAMELRRARYDVRTYREGP